ncbi:hypothetical protein [Arthrobacter sp. NEB 688]|uniref:hypothetical protein n=1 Tax=Arthrobacter sp. NEB 688 TaxID=904039 RepID=UPI001565C8AB|nr:hypothetical protein [Arthrobacter sp. NEB 688]QKE85794.1 hypothetical protein HL663_18955 [Arthrobacter sp. NEB 688]
MANGPNGIRRVVHRARRAVLERTARQGTEPVDLDSLISPLRYDVVVRARLFDLLAQEPDLGGDALVRRAAGTAYADWFVHVECARFFPELLQDKAVRDERFAARVHGAARLLRSFEERGFDAASPVTLLTAPAGTASESGAPALGGLHIGDGCHRVSLLLRAGATLEPWMYKVRPSLGPLVDNTAVLLRHGALDEQEYVAFLAARFPVGGARTVQEALATVEAVDAGAAPTLRAVTDAQRPGGPGRA